MNHNHTQRPANGGESPEHLDVHSDNLVSARAAALLRLFPEAGTEGTGIDFDRLKLALGEAIETGRERYGMTWPGKADCFKTIQTPSIATLVPATGESVRFDTTDNVIIEGDNLEALKLLQKSYTGKIKAIYIDPPYNTGHDFVYPDNFDEPLRAYLALTGQVDEEGKRLRTNTDSDGRFHSNWLNMMYPRLYLARNLLREDGVIFISIDDNEIANLRKLCDEVFGEENFIACIEWNSTKSVTNTALVSVGHTHNLVFARDKRYFIENRHHFRLEDPGTGFSNPDNDPRGPWKADPFQVGGERPNQRYEIVNPVTGKAYRPNPGCSWKNDSVKFAELLADNRIVFGVSGEAGPQRKRFQSEAQERGRVAKTWWDDIATTANGTADLRELFDNLPVFDNPKPAELIERFLELGMHDPHDALILDFFAGSGTTAQAVLELNAKDGGNRKFILVQLPEPTDREDYPTIADVTKERVRRVIKKLGTDDGFRVFKLAESNFTTWDAGAAQDADGLARQLQLHVDHVRPGRSDDALLYEILLKSGYSLTVPVERLALSGTVAYSVDGGKMLVCLERTLTIDAIRAMADAKPERIVCLDAGFAGNDQLKTNAVQIFKTKGVSSFKTV